MPSIKCDTLTVGAMSIRFLVESDDSRGAITIFECGVPAQSRMPAPHSHGAFEETIYGLAGVTTFTIDGENVEIGPGDAVCITRGTIHGFDNHGESDARFLAMATPGVFGRSYFEDICAVLAEAAGGPPDHSAIGEVMRRHGLTPAPPAD